MGLAAGAQDVVQQELLLMRPVFSRFLPSSQYCRNPGFF
jgi:hypothetical protein